jgi:type IV pilus assembly protein PilX
MRSQKDFSVTRQQRGAALVIGLILLLVLTLLAVSSMSSASLEFIMAGNEQYRANAFQAAEVGISQVFVQANLNPDAGPQTVTGVSNGKDSWSATVTLPVGAKATAPPSNTSLTTFSGYQFEIVSTGTSTRGATAVNTQGVWVLAPPNGALQNEN